MTKKDMTLAAVILCLAAVFFLWNKSIHKAPAASVEVTIDGKVVETLDLHKDQELEIKSTTGGTNHLIIKDGEAWISDASCPDKICIRQGKVKKDGEMIVCLPNLMIVQIKGEQP